jgi:hypothetical protein
LTDTLHAFGDSFVVGDQDDFLGQVPGATHGMPWYERLEYLKTQVSFVSILARHYGYHLQNHAERGSGNYPQIDRVWLNLINGNIKPGDIVLFGITTTIRDRFLLHEVDRCTNDSQGPFMIDRKLIAKDSERQRLLELDYFYILSLLDQLSRKFGVRIVKFNLFDNSLDHANSRITDLCQVDDFVGWATPGNTLIDILNDSWGQGVFYTFAHEEIKIPRGFEYLYTAKKHPSIAGHQKIADWWIRNNILSNHVASVN